MVARLIDADDDLKKHDILNKYRYRFAAIKISALNCL